MAKSKESLILFFARPEHRGLRVDKVLAEHPEIQTRTRAAKLLHDQQVLRCGHPVKPSYKVQIGDEFAVSLPAPQPTGLVPYDFPLNILFEDRELIVVNKPAGLVVHPAAGHTGDTLVNALIHHSKDLAMGFGEDRPGIVHRLDKDTSGLLVVAKNDRAQLFLSQQFKARTTHRLYWAIVHGAPKGKSGTITSNLRRHPTDRKRFASDRNNLGKRAVTHFEVKQIHSNELALLHCRLETGRTHQIRVHLSEHGWPLIGDRLYGAHRRLASVSSVSLRTTIGQLKRIGLHAAELGFVHPTTGERHVFRAGWPEDLIPIVEALGWL